MDTPETGFFRTESGVVTEMDLPLSEPIAQRVKRGEIVRVTPVRVPKGAPKRWAPWEAPPVEDPGPSLADELAEVKRQLAEVTKERDELKAAAPKPN
jgi:hypothetical protein